MPDAKKAVRQVSPIKKPLRIVAALGLATLMGAGLFALTWLRAWPNASLNSHQAATPDAVTTLDPVTNPVTIAFRVSGSSMVPALIGPAHRTHCSTCGRNDLVSAAFAETLQRHRACGVCGGRLLLAQPRDKQAKSSLYAGDIVQVIELDTAETRALQIGDLVAVKHENKLRVKRIAATAGDRITLSHQRILVNDVRLEDLIVKKNKSALHATDTLIVDDDARQPNSRWTSLHGESWVHTNQRHWKPNANIALNDDWSEWLVYHHRNVHDNNKASAVMDDYPFNVGVARRMNEADRLQATLQFEASDPVKIQVAFWSQDGVFVSQHTHPSSNAGTASDTMTTSYYEALPWSSANIGTPLPVTQQSPVAIRIQGNSDTTELRNISLRRFVEYRIRDSDRDDLHQRQLGVGEVFVVGDNVPVSEDSRQWGVLPINSIVGRVARIDRDNR